MKILVREAGAVIFAVFSTIALFVDVESTGNLSMALNGDGIPQLIALLPYLIAFYPYSMTWDGGVQIGKAPIILINKVIGAFCV
jgi:hypothetical protein